MKKTFFLFMSLAMVALMASCNKQINHPVSGHSYEARYETSENDTVKQYQQRVTFLSDGICVYESISSSDTINSGDCLIWNVENNQIVVREKTILIPQSEGMEFFTFEYNDSTSTLILHSTLDVIFNQVD